MAPAIRHGKPELSTLLESGTFYFALTVRRIKPAGTAPGIERPPDDSFLGAILFRMRFWNF
jgi:hypothetical protein